MREHLTIGEAAELLGISTYNLRYYQKEGIIKPSHLAGNGYRLFSLDDIMHIRCIMLLRESGIPIKGIKALIGDYNQANYVKALEKSYSEVKEKISRLKKLKEELEKNLDAAKNKDDFFQVIYYEENRAFYQIKILDYDAELCAKDVYELANSFGEKKDNFIIDKSYYILHEDVMSVCLLSDEHKNVINFEQGSYLCYSFSVEDDSEILEKVGLMAAYMEQNNMKDDGELLFTVNLRSSLGVKRGYHGELQIKIK